MLGLFGIFGVLLAGLVADSMIAGTQAKSDEGDDPAPQDPDAPTEDPAEGGNLMDWAAGGDPPDHPVPLSPDDPDYEVLSNDLPDAPDPLMTLTGGGADDILSGLGGDDTLTGGDGADQLTGRDGDDYAQGGAGDDLLHGGAGADTLQGNAGDDLLVGQDGDDKLVGGAGADTLLGHEGDDSLYGGAGPDKLIGGGGDDRLVGGGADDWLAGGAGHDDLIGDAGGDTLDGGAGNDLLDGREDPNAFPEMDFLNGGEGDDTLWLGAGDYATGGEGADWFVLSDLSPGYAIANIADYNGAEDALVVVFDPVLHPYPHLSLETPENTDDVVVILDGVPLAMVRGGAGLTLDDVLLTPAQAA